MKETIMNLEEYQINERLYIPEPNSGCWLWIGGQTTEGYGLLYKTNSTTGERKHITAHRAMWEQTFGVIKESGLVVCHKCDFPPCVNPDHLFLGTPRDNALDMIAKGRQTKQQKKHKHQISEMYNLLAAQWRLAAKLQDAIDKRGNR